jgi:hypothetical protein
MHTPSQPPKVFFTSPSPPHFLGHLLCLLPLLTLFHAEFVSGAAAISLDTSYFVAASAAPSPLTASPASPQPQVPTTGDLL